MGNSIKPSGGGTASLYTEKDQKYFSCVRDDIVQIVPCPAGRVLEIGCAGSGTLRTLKRDRGATEIHGIDIAADADGLDSFHRLDIEAGELPYDDEWFDVIVCADVFEHLIDPWRAISRTVRCLRSGGVLVASFPNVRYYRVLARIVFRGDFRYAKTGILDHGHLRFFCFQNMRDLLESAGVTIEEVRHNLKGRRALLNRIVGGWLEPFMAFQYRFVARKVVGKATGASS